MEFNINAVLGDMLASMKNEVGKNWNKVETPAKQMLDNRKSRLVMLAKFRISNELTDEEFKSRLEDEKLLAEAELNALEVLSKVVAQNAVNAALEVLAKAVRLAVKPICT